MDRGQAETREDSILSASYRHRFLDGAVSPLPTGKVVCVARSYREHARELHNQEAEEPILFMKPTSALVSFAEPIRLPHYSRACHFETEIAILIGETLHRATPDRVSRAIVGYAGALDLTLRDVQARLKQAGHPWELAKAFDRSCPMTPFIRSHDLLSDVKNGLRFSLHINEELRQEGNTLDMTWDLLSLLATISGYFTLDPGDVVLTGTPAGVGPLSPRDHLVLTIQGYHLFETTVAESSI
ncbi:MAG: fumarylacetoacetate hydrolase family protein [Magnetococcales bacterium]|nr:fumarylacetoacetate hydrolase family protein [Magnetococcales bacterium]